MKWKQTSSQDKFKFNVIEINEIINRRRNDVDEEIKYLINCLWYKASQISRLNMELVEQNHEIIKLCWEIFKKRLQDKQTSFKDMRIIKESAERIIKEITWDNTSDRNVSVKTRFDILYRDDFTCTYCWRKAPDVILHIDHKLPFSKWWKTIIDNLITSCSDCNLGKKNRYDTSEKR